MVTSSSGYDVSYLHFNRAGGGGLAPISDPQVVNALQTKFEWQFRRGLTLLSSLTLSQTKDSGAPPSPRPTIPASSSWV